MQSDVRAVLQYVPSFRGKVFVLVIDAGRMPELALAEALLDLSALQQVGVRLVVVSTGSGDAQISHRLVDGELKWETCQLSAGERLSEILARGQLALIEEAELEVLGDEVAKLACDLRAAKLIVFHSEQITHEGLRLHAISREQALDWSGNAASLFHAAAEVCGKGVPRVHLLDETRQGVLMDELFSNEGVGVMIHSDDYLSVRPLEVDDISELLAMIGRSIREAHLVPRSYEEIESNLSHFQVLTVDDNVVGCIALHPYGKQCGEVACLYVKQSHGSEGYGQLLVEAAEKRACELDLPWVFALSTRAADYFVDQLGYERMDVSEIPMHRLQRLEQSGRDSIVIRKELR
ncbi:MAG: GNAT family N-acetyltransferase [Akkermansiaceae bacterium]